MRTQHRFHCDLSPIFESTLNSRSCRFDLRIQLYRLDVYSAVLGHDMPPLQDSASSLTDHYLPRFVLRRMGSLAVMPCCFSYASTSLEAFWISSLRGSQVES